METMESEGRKSFAGIWYEWRENHHLRELDWEDFNAERRFWEHYSSDQEKLYMQREVENMDLLNSEQLLDCIENRQMWEILKNTDPKTIEMILMKIWGFSVKEISEYLNLPEKLL